MTTNTADLHADEVNMAQRLRDIGYMTGTCLHDWERDALRRMVEDRRVTWNPETARPYELTPAGRAWLAEHEPQ